MSLKRFMVALNIVVTTNQGKAGMGCISRIKGSVCEIHGFEFKKKKKWLFPHLLNQVVGTSTKLDHKNK